MIENRSPEAGSDPGLRAFLNVSGFSDAVFSVAAAFLADYSGRFVSEVEAVKL